MKHWIVVNSDDTGSAVFTKISHAWAERDNTQRVRACDCDKPESHIGKRVDPKFSRHEQV